MFGVRRKGGPATTTAYQTTFIYIYTRNATTQHTNRILRSMFALAAQAAHYTKTVVCETTQKGAQGSFFRQGECMRREWRLENDARQCVFGTSLDVVIRRIVVGVVLLFSRLYLYCV